MSAGRIFPIVVAACWLASMTWLIQTKVIPMMAVAAAPHAHRVPKLPADAPIEDRWTIQWNDQSIGSVYTKAYRDAAHGQIDSVVALDNAPADQMLNEFFGPASQLIKRATRDFQTNSLTLRLTNTMMLDYAGSLESFDSRVYLGSVGDLFRLSGTTDANTLTVDVHPIGDFWPESFPKKLLTRQFELPSGAFVVDAFSPPAELQNLRVGKTWQYHTYRALSPSQPMQRIQAKVEANESIGWQGQAENTYVVTLRSVGSDLSVADDVVGKMWVKSDGVVVRQSLRFGNLVIVFVRDETIYENNTVQGPLENNAAVDQESASNRNRSDLGNGNTKDRLRTESTEPTP